jgi:hypothetical protein
MDDDDRTCRICYDTTDDWTNRLVDACGCKGSMRWIHVACVKSGLLHGHTTCRACGTEYTAYGLTKTRIADMQRRLNEATKAAGGMFRYDESKFRHAGQYVSSRKPTIESAVLVLEDDRFRRAFESAVKSFLAGPAPRKPKAMPKSVPILRPRSKSDDIRITLKQPDGTSSIIFVQPTEAIDVLWTTYADETGISAFQLRFVSNGCPLGFGSGRTFADERIGADAVVHVLYNLL